MGFGDDNIIIDIKKFFCDEFCSDQLISILMTKFQLLLKPCFSYSDGYLGVQYCPITNYY